MRKRTQDENLPEKQRKNRKKSKEETKRTSTKTSRNSVRNREFAVITYCFMGLFVSLMGYFIYFQVYKSDEFINSPYNTRQAAFSQKITRGSILAAGGEVLAETKTDAEGNESRVYPYNNLFSHIVGYSTKGTSGVEALENFDLLRSHTNFVDKAMNEVTDAKSPGDNAVTTLNYNLQYTAYNSLGGNNGAIVVLEPSTGKILAMVSKPDFNPNTLATEWDDIVADTNAESVLVNRATSGKYPPGSIFKILTALEYIRENPTTYNEYRYQCSGGISDGVNILHCYGNEVHGSIDLKESFAESCNTSFANIGLSLDADKYAKFCESMLFNQSLPTDLEASKSSFVLNSSSGTSQVMATAIGQGETLVTPLHMAMISAAIANDGILMRPYVVDRIENAEGTQVSSSQPKEAGTLLSLQEASILQEYMKAVVTEGTGSKLNGLSYEAAGKTGSAEYSDAKDTHAWFVGYAHQEGKEDIAIAVIVEGVGVGSSYAVPIAKEVFDAYYNQ